MGFCSVEMDFLSGPDLQNGQVSKSGKNTSQVSGIKK